MFRNADSVRYPAFRNADFVQVIRGPFFQPFAETMLPAQLANVAAAALPRPPTVQAFFERLRMSHETPPPNNASRELFGDTFADAEPKPAGTEKTQKMALSAANDFAKVLEVKGVVITEMDEWLTAFAQWSLGVEWLFDDKEAADGALAQREALCSQAKVVARCWMPQSLKTVVNALALMYKQTGPVDCIVPSVDNQFPRYCRFFNAACTRHKNKQARQPLEKSLTDDELVSLFDKTQWKSWYESQRMSLLVLAYQVGQRPETLIRLCVGNFHQKVSHDGTEGLQINFGTMKNLQGNQANANKPAHIQYVMKHANPKLCAIAAHGRQMELIGKASSPSSPMFRGARIYTNSAPPNAATYSIIRGIAQWVRAAVGRPLTFKDCARRPVLTRLANALSVHDAAKAMGVAPRTIDRYHAADGPAVSSKAAAVLAQVLKRQNDWPTRVFPHSGPKPKATTWNGLHSIGGRGGILGVLHDALAIKFCRHPPRERRDEWTQ